MSIEQGYDLLCIGNYTKDTIITPAGIRYVDGGAINYAAHAAARLGLHVAVVTHLAIDDQRVVDKFHQDGIASFITYTPSSTCMKLEYPTLNPDIRTLSVACTAGQITASEVKDISTRAAVIGSSLRGEVDLDVIYALKHKKVFLGADMQGFVRVLRGQSLVYEPWPELSELAPLLDVLKSDGVEAEHLTGETDIYKAARKYARLGAKEVILTHKEGLLVLAGGKFHRINFYSRTLDGRSGRGDTCLGAYMAMRLTLDPCRAGVWAAAVTSLKMEKLGPFDCDRQEVLSLIEDKYAAHFPELLTNQP